MVTGDRRGGVTAGFAVVQTQITRHRDFVVPSAGDRKVSAGLAVGPSYHQVVRLRRPLREGRGCGGFGTVLNFLIGSPSCTVISFICVQWFFWQLEDSNVRHSFCSLFVRKRWTGRARGVRGWKASHQTLSLGPEVVLLWAFNFNRDKILCTIFWVHNGLTSQRGTFSLVDLK
jgi:hypothetical protein